MSTLIQLGDGTLLAVDAQTVCRVYAAGRVDQVCTAGALCVGEVVAVGMGGDYWVVGTVVMGRGQVQKSG